MSAIYMCLLYLCMPKVQSAVHILYIFANNSELGTKIDSLLQKRPIDLLFHAIFSHETIINHQKRNFT